MNKSFKNFAEVEALDINDLKNDEIRQAAIAYAEARLANANKLYESACHAPSGSILNIQGKRAAEIQIEQIQGWLYNQKKEES